MPAPYAFHRFGDEALSALPENRQRPIRRFRRLYNGGLLGADLFFWFRPLMSSPVGELYQTYHSMTGREFFTQACELLKQNPSEGASACLYGLLAHYCLSTRLTALFRQQTDLGSVSRTELEVELDRYLLSLDGKQPAHQQDVSPGYKMTRGECVTVSQFFPPATAQNTHAAYGSMVFWSRRFAAKKRSFTETVLKTAPGTFRQQMMPDHANHRCLHLDEAMAACLKEALDLYPIMAEQLTAHRETGAPLGELFESSFH